MSKENLKNLISFHTYHSAGIEGNTLTLPETFLVIDDKKILSGFKDDKKFSPSTTRSITEI